ncbi:peptide methionine sulfoxide reductase [Liquorilactobacillus ghanensis DSM 18630]|uniref:Peptide methionine sulfoxide reductase MsrA n=1 Tax=Liquorilactobacillus ghanensis DSM 18630 TaxID=1423750 RepID=A0A0R1VI10_9LACO|nr:peptide-methionine (S)-S-oxide reductase MsrA [Liquorilactobacillus ghanensis]KRM05272.1 peptide methionine sulfoxide reductase [Liquorilactobacillus ghanensis DSM 18630]
MNDLPNLSEQVYNLILNPATRDWERQQLVAAKNALTERNVATVWAELEYRLRPLAVRNNLTPAVADFYAILSHDENGGQSFDLTIHFASDPPWQKRAIFAGGCFWCLVEPFELRPGIIAVISGYTGGKTAAPTYETVSSQNTGHVEAVEIIFDSREIDYEDLLELYWKLIDPTDVDGQINDRGSNYRPVIFVRDRQQRQAAEKSKQALNDARKFSKPIVVPIETATKFWPAENYHQQFYRKHPQRYRLIARTRKQYLLALRVAGKLKNIFSK